MKIKVTDFGKRHFDPKFGATKILDYTVEQFESIVNNSYTYGNSENISTFSGIKFEGYLFNCFDRPKSNEKSELCKTLFVESLPCIDGYAPFCKLLPIRNFTNARVGSLPITLENYQYIRSGYSSRTEKELPVFSRWLELPLGKPKAEWLMLVLYSYDQLLKEYVEGYSEAPFLFDAEWGIVAILGQSNSDEEPMKPETMLRNALGTSEGGSGVPIDREKYLASADFWNKNCTVK